MGLLSSAHAENWKKILKEQLPLLGHRNWIVIVDSAYPWQVSSGIRTVETGATQVEVVNTVLNTIKGSQHVHPTIYLDRELDYVPEDLSPGINGYRSDLSKIFGKTQTIRLPHEQIIRKLDEAGKTFHVLVLKTTMTMPYTSVFLELGCGYWNDASEKRLRSLIPNG